MAAYAVARIDLTKVVDRQLLQSTQGNPVNSVTVVSLPQQAAGIPLLHAARGEGIPVLVQGVEFTFCKPVTEGIYVSVPTAATGTLVLLLAFAGTGNIQVTGGGSPAQSLLSPQSPIHGTVLTNGSVNGPATIQLTSPSKTLLVYEWRATKGASSVRWRMRRTAAPLLNLFGAGGTVVSATLQRLDERDATPITGLLRGTNFTNNGDTFTEAQAQYFATGVNGENSVLALGSQIRPAGGFPWIVKPGSGIEMAAGENGAGIIISAYVVFDEI